MIKAPNNATSSDGTLTVLIMKFCNKYNDRQKANRNERAVGIFTYKRKSDHVHTHILVRTLLNDPVTFTEDWFEYYKNRVFL